MSTSNSEANFLIRRANLADVEGLLTCLLEAFKPYRSEYTPEAFADTVLTPETILQRLKSMTVFTAVGPSGEIVGTVGCACANGEGHIRGMAVRPDYFGRGLAQALIETAEREFNRQGCVRVTLDTTACLDRAQSFYRRNGYAATGVVYDFFGMPLYEFAKDLVV